MTVGKLKNQRPSVAFSRSLLNEAGLVGLLIAYGGMIELPCV